MNVLAAAALVLTCVLTCTASSQELRVPFPPQEPMTFYVVKGAPDSCGRGCDSWIEAEGTIETDSPARFRVILNRLVDRNLPIYFASPGGNLERALTMGSMLHARPIVARVGRTVVRECGLEPQNSAFCIQLKNSGRELHGELRTDALCASACPFFFGGATVREVAPDAVLAVHSPKIVRNPRSSLPDAPVTAAADQLGHEHFDRQAAVYLAKMGIDGELLTLMKTVRFEDIHDLTRDEIARFGFDRREFVETPWKLASTGLDISKIAVVRRPGETSFRLLQWRVSCLDADRLALHFLRPAAASPVLLSPVSIAGDAGPIYFDRSPATESGLEQWVLRLRQSDLQSLMDQPQIELTETSPAADGGRIPRTIKLSSEGGADALAALVLSCPPAKGSAALQATRPAETTAK